MENRQDLWEPSASHTTIRKDEPNMEKESQQARWNLSDLYPNIDAWRSGRAQLETAAQELASLRGKVTSSAETLLHTLQLSDECGIQLTRLFVYAKSLFDGDMGDQTGKELYETICGTWSSIGEQTAFLTPELMQMTPETFAEYCSSCSSLALYQHYMDDLFAKKEHILDDRTEGLLVRMNDLSDSYQKIFSDLIVNDVKYEEIQTPEGETVTVNDASYGAAMIHPDREYRAKYFNLLLGGVYGGHINTLSSNYYALVKSDVYIAKSRNYPSARAMALDNNHIPEEVYDNLIQNVRDNVAPLQRYISLRKKVLGIDDFHFYDFFVPIVADVDRKYPYEEGCDYLLKATSILGEDYTALVHRALDERWSDVYPRKGKVSGAYSTGAFGVHPYMLLNYDDTLDDVFTLVHEMGHSMHTHYSEQNQPYIYSDYSIFCAEVASTTNEMLLYHYMLEHAQSKEEKALLLSKHLDDIRSTFYRQTMFADFENQTHRLVEKGAPLLPSTLCEIHRKLNQDYYGPEFVADDTISYEWSRIPHFYRAFYVYQYATGISAAIAISRRILEKGESAVADYKKFLSAGCSGHPIDVLRYAGVDMASPQPVLDTVADFAETLRQLEELL